MVTCDECGRSGHPRCMQLDSAAELMYSYPWKCAECKPCEVCNDKEDDVRVRLETHSPLLPLTHISRAACCVVIPATEVRWIGLPVMITSNGIP
ncbi:uncharacterized protein STEHIDRAFT_50161 [Stereum hirsutum FP-91666 SS1]|uniref:uncharacterized protein n=1 Tax=Stereum hirsutum (strain FP-91666) TaxID=721885 RepID=UPI000440A6AF|nr:uncharacterized protein STEHIDRAFT_50161 [Stereum hirsutum FP-91666 SS1]EIM91009.1 hypothetical protein STEHIDRAFT_50161 [Stereum hirsutum FP-91666 SS1]